MQNSPVVEIVLFKAKAGISDAEVMDAVTFSQTWLETQPGYIRRETLKDEEGQWIDVVHWHSRKEALEAGERIMTSAAGEKFGQVIDERQMTMMHLNQVAVYA